MADDLPGHDGDEFEQDVAIVAQRPYQLGFVCLAERITNDPVDGLVVGRTEPTDDRVG
jgi:hypothetical protein